MSNVHRTRDGLPVNFIDGLKIKSINIEDLFAEQKAYTDSLVTGETTLSVTGHAPNAIINLTPSQASKPIIQITGILTTSITVTIPYNTIRPLLVVNATTGGFIITLKNLLSDGNASLTTVTLSPGQKKFTYTTFSEIIEGSGNLNDLALTGSPTAPTPALGNSSNKIATTEFVFNNKPAFAEGENGYYIDPVSLFVIQWGVVRYGPNYGDYSFVDSPVGSTLFVNFTYSFAMNTFTVTATGVNLASPPDLEGSEMNIGVSNLLTSGGTFLVSRTSGSNIAGSENGVIHWHAIGKAFS